MSTHAVTGAVLAGGASRRMGRDKALIDVGGRTLIDRALDVMADFDQVVVLGGSAQVAQICSRRGVEVLADVHPGSGPLMAILAAVEQVGDLVALAVDMAGVEARNVDGGCAACARTMECVGVPRSDGGCEWRCAVVVRGRGAR